MRAALAAISYSDVDITKSYKAVRQIHTAFGRGSGPYKMWDHCVRGEHRDIPVRIFTPENRSPHDIILFFHGGGWVIGNIDSYTKVCIALAQHTNQMVVSVDYRLAPEHKFPAAPEDCYSVARELFLNPALLGTMPERITLMGDSAGGNLAAVVSLMARDRGEFMPTRQILVYPATQFDHTEQSPFESVRTCGTEFLLTSKRVCDYMALYLRGPEDEQNPYVSPLCEPDLTGQPRTLILTAEYDPLRDEGEAYAERLREAGVEVDCRRVQDALHGFLALPPRYEPVQEAFSCINRFLRGVSLEQPREVDAHEP